MSQTSSSKALLEGIQRVAFDVNMCPFPGSLQSCMQYIKDPCDYDFLMGVTGAAFRRFFEKNDGANVDLMYLQPEPYKRAFEALNYSYKVVLPGNKQVMFQEMKSSIDRGVPVLAFGIIGPPECGIIAGYDKDGDVVYGYSYFQNWENKGYYEQPDWYEKAEWGAESAADWFDYHW